MSLITLLRNNPVYAYTRGATVAGGGATSVLFAFAATHLSSNGITINSATRITVGEAGYYEILIALETQTSPVGAVSIQTGVNGAWTTQSTNAPGSNPRTFGAYAFIIEIPKNGYFEIRAVSGVGLFDVICGWGQDDVNSITPNIVIRKL